MVQQWIRCQLLGCGGQNASVYLASSAPSGILFAVKSKLLTQAGDLQRERSILSSLHSPYIISYLGWDITIDATTMQSVYNLHMEYAVGGSLSDEIKKKGGMLPEGWIRVRTCQILHGLVYLHDKGVIHCDVKPQNILIGSNGCAKIADFGCAKWEFTSNTEAIGGTLNFMAPEVVRREKQGKTADIWALGCTVIEMATGQSPWQDVRDPISAMQRIGLSHEVPLVPSWLSLEAKDFLSKCFRRDWRQRWSCKKLLQHPFISNVRLS
ncbi:Mitogen-activated protein kinase kinase kinase A [Rhynchospora pubera]|uniref:Mitogen-activated protein kinase kinase kinase A n=1 Tax=Rhynchospora pubera TaxID=906938 RepID=A0AAV8DGL4_9POAL|nr:Mitogen-activated protein kinase kinase kinase A [Rhynchospora pubera]